MLLFRTFLLLSVSSAANVALDVDTKSNEATKSLQNPVPSTGRSIRGKSTASMAVATVPTSNGDLSDSDAAMALQQILEMKETMNRGMADLEAMLAGRPGPVSSEGGIHSASVQDRHDSKNTQNLVTLEEKVHTQTVEIDSLKTELIAAMKKLAERETAPKEGKDSRALQRERTNTNDVAIFQSTNQGNNKDQTKRLICEIDDNGGVKLLEISEESYAAQIKNIENGTYYLPTIYYKDSDGDGYGYADINLTQCFKPIDASYIEVTGDCNDTDSGINPAALEICGNGKDDDCSDETTDTDATSCITLGSNESFVPLCKTDSRGYAVSPSDTRYSSSSLQMSEEIKFFDIETQANLVESAASSVLTGIFDAAGTISFYRALVNEFLVKLELAKDIADISPSTISRTTTAFKRMSALSYVFPALSIAVTVLDIVGIFGGSQSDAEVTLSAINEGFNQMYDRFNDLEEVILESLTEIKRFVADVELDEIAAKLSSLMRAYQAYVQASGTNSTGSNSISQVYSTAFTTMCNTPGYKPDFLLFELYGYACTNCTYAPKKRADFIEQFKDFADFSPTKFMGSFGNFLISEMTRAIFLHTVCPPPVEIPCSDGIEDTIWGDTFVSMVGALDETAETLDAVGPELDSKWVLALSNDDIKDYIAAFVRGGTMDKYTLQDVADDLFAQLSELHPEYYLQVIVYQDPAYTEFAFPFAFIDKFDKTVDNQISYYPSLCGEPTSSLWPETCVEGSDSGFKNFFGIDVSDLASENLFEGNGLLEAGPEISVMLRLIYNETYVDSTSNTTNVTYVLADQTEPEDSYDALLGEEYYLFLACFGNSNDCSTFHYSYGIEKLLTTGFFLGNKLLLEGGTLIEEGAIGAGAFGVSSHGSEYFPNKTITDNFQTWLAFY